MKTHSASPSGAINGTLCLGCLDAGQRAEPASTTHTNNRAAQCYQISVLAQDKFKHMVPGEGGVEEGGCVRMRRGGAGEGVIEEMRQRSMFDTALIPLLSVKWFQHCNNTGP